MLKKIISRQSVGWAAGSIGVVAFAVVSLTLFHQSGDSSDSSRKMRVPAAAHPKVEDEYPHRIGKNTTLYDVLRRMGMSPQSIYGLVNAAKPHVDLSRIHPDTRFTVYPEKGPVREPSSIKFRFSPVDFLEVSRNMDDSWSAKPIHEEVEIRVVDFTGIVKSSLWESATEVDMDPQLIVELAEIFAWQVDFAREVRENDRWRLTVERRYVQGRPVSWGRILAAEYENGDEIHSAVLFEKNGKNMGYFAPDGSSLKRMFLKSPIRFGRISSRFTMRRFHPILKRNRPHLGVDYAAPIGTPVRAVGAGRVEFAGWSGGGGRVIRIRHNSVYKTAYKHLSGYAPGIRRGAKIEQGQTIGYVGSTGLSTGPHLHFEFYERGRFVNPFGRKFPSADPVPAADRETFRQLALAELAGLPPWRHRDSQKNAIANIKTQDPAVVAD